MGSGLVSGDILNFKLLRAEVSRTYRALVDSHKRNLISNSRRKCHGDFAQSKNDINSYKIPEISLTDLYVDSRIRPLTARLRRQLFDILPDLTGYTVFDLCAGTGILGLEAVRHGARHAVMVDTNVPACRAIQAVAKKYGILTFASSRYQELTAPDGNAPTPRVDVIYGDARKVQIPFKCDLVFVDPPFDKGLMQPILENLRKSNSCHSSTTVVLRASKREDVNTDWLRCVRDIRHGDGMLYFCQVRASDEQITSNQDNAA